MIDVCIIGTGGGMPMPNRFLAALLIKHGGKKILVDSGEGTQVSVRKNGWGFKTIDIICITHFHGDHIVGLPGLLATIGNSERLEPITIIGPEGIKKVMEGLGVIIPYLPYQLNIIEAFKDKFNFGDIEISTLPLEHSAPCIGYSFYIKRKPKFDVQLANNNGVPKIYWNRLQKGETIVEKDKIYTSDMVLGDDRKGIKLAYITDTRPIEEIGDFVCDSDLFICEGTYGEDEKIENAIKNKHMTFREAGELARAGNVEELILTHFSPSMNSPEEYLINCSRVFENTSIAYDGMVKTLKFG